MKKIIITGASFILFATVNTKADEKFDHFPSVAAPNTQVALCNLASFNKQLGLLANKKALSAEEMVKVHELTYTLENAVQRLQSDLNTIAADLEKVHKASERLDGQTVNQSGQAYLAATQLLLTPKPCN